MFSFVKTRFVLDRNVHLHNKDSVEFLRELSTDASVPKERVFFYLDAHWLKHLPLREELELIASAWKRPIIMIDDFCVPDPPTGSIATGPI